MAVEEFRVWRQAPDPESLMESMAGGIFISIEEWCPEEKITMERVAFKLRLREGKRDEYKKMHDNIWPELIEVLKEAGIQNYTIWNSGDDLFGYYEVPDTSRSNHILANSPVIARWNEAMSNIYYPDIDPETGTVREMKLMFKYNLTEANDFALDERENFS